ncbi:hypothetical protein EI94DRAFT_620892 [Lactarius quietus]|nr:hypothetical protein EI94DRAFT_620892 [Lactarius quietus]
MRHGLTGGEDRSGCAECGRRTTQPFCVPAHGRGAPEERELARTWGHPRTRFACDWCFKFQPLFRLAPPPLAHALLMRLQDTDSSFQAIPLAFFPIAIARTRMNLRDMGVYCRTNSGRAVPKRKATASLASTWLQSRNDHLCRHDRTRKSARWTVYFIFTFFYWRKRALFSQMDMVLCSSSRVARSTAYPVMQDLRLTTKAIVQYRQGVLSWYRGCQIGAGGVASRLTELIGV